MRRTAFIFVLLIGAASATAAADQFDYVRLGSHVRLDGGDFNSAYSVEMAQELSVANRPGGTPGSGGGGGDGEGQKSYDGATHRLYAYYGLTNYLDFGAEQSLKQSSSNVWTYGVLMPRLTLKLNSLAPDAFSGMPVVFSTFLGSQVRVNARRNSSLIAGIGLDKAMGRLSLMGSVAFEATMDAVGHENGLRYEAGAAWRFWGPFSANVESWGTAVWPVDGVFQQTVHAGPSLKLRLERVWVSANASYGFKEQPNKYFTDMTYLLQLGLGI